jgi:hypothetical protein
MPSQLIYTSAPRGLLSGQSGFCTVARSGDLREALAQRLEQISSYHYLRVAEAATANRNPTVCAFRILDLRGTKYHVLTRIVPCGLDFTARTNHLAHHLVFQAGELAQLPSPAAILRYWNGWLASWQGDPCILEDPSLDGFGTLAHSCLPANTWLRVTGDAGRAAGLLESECVRGCYLICPPGSEQQVLDMFCETLQLLNFNGQSALRPWRHPFTTFLQAEDNPADFQWRACQEGTPAHQQAMRRTGTLLPLRSVRVPNHSLVKVAREGLKPPAPPAAAPTESILALRSHPPGRRPVTVARTDTTRWQTLVEGAEKPDSRGRNISIHPAMLARIGLVAAVLLTLLGVKHWLSQRHAAPPGAPQITPTQPKPAAPAQSSRQPPLSAQAAPLDLTPLDRLSGDGPTYVLASANLTAFSLPIDSISRFQNLLNRFDHLETHPNDIQASLNTDQWDFSSGAPLIVNSRQTQALSGQTAAGLECSFDYANWKSDPHNPVAIHTTFFAPPGAFSVHFAFADPNKGEPFRLLIVNENNSPAPLRLDLQWLRKDGASVAASLQAPLGERLFGNFMLPPERHWQLQPFIHGPGARPTRYLYQDWPPEDLPPAGDELDFATVKRHLTAELPPLNGKAAAFAQKLDQQIKKAAFDNPLGKDLGITNKNLASFASFASDPSSADFISYLNSLKKRSGIKGWPRLAEDEDETERAAKFQQLYDLLIGNNPEEKPKLTVGNNNYFSDAWQNLKDIEKVRREKQRVQDEIDKIQARLSVVPEALDKVAYVGLFIIDPPKPGLEMIRFEGP